MVEHAKNYLTNSIIEQIISPEGLTDEIYNAFLATLAYSESEEYAKGEEFTAEEVRDAILIELSEAFEKLEIDTRLMKFSREYIVVILDWARQKIYSQDLEPTSLIWTNPHGVNKEDMYQRSPESVLYTVGFADDNCQILLDPLGEKIRLEYCFIPNDTEATN